MTDIDPLLQRNNDFAATFPHEEASIVARHQVCVLTCLDPRSDPSAFLDLEVGDAMVVRNADGRVSADVLRGRRRSRRTGAAQPGPDEILERDPPRPDLRAPRSSPDVLDGDVIDPEGHQLHIITVGQSDTAPSTKVYIPGLNAVIAGDVAYNGIHQWLADTDHEKRMQWIASVEQIEALDPAVVVASHKRPDAPDDDFAAVLGGTKTCIRDFDQSCRRAIRPRNWPTR